MRNGAAPIQVGVEAGREAKVEERLFETADALNAALADELAARLAAQIAAAGSATLVCSGGTTPGPVYDRLAQHAIDWTRVTVTGSDERWLSPDDPASLDHLLAERLFQGPAAAARWVPLYAPVMAPDAAEPVIEARLRALERPFTAVVLGMGLDGHTASLFPDAPQLDRALDLDDPALVRAIGPVDGAAGSAWRISLTLRALLDARHVALLFRGVEKLAVYRAARGDGSGSNDLPISAVLHQRRAPVTLYWAP